MSVNERLSLVRDRGVAELRGGLEDGQQPVSVRIRQGTQENAVHHAKNGRIRADAEGQRQHRDGGEAGVLS